MKKSLIALAALAAVGVASAQSSVTLSGGLNIGYGSTAGVKTVANNQGAANHLTFTASEDLGGGLRATGAINIRFNPATGYNIGNGGSALPTTAGADDPDEFDAGAQNIFLGIAGGFGEIRLGRFTNVVQGPLGGYDPFGTDSNGVGSDSAHLVSRTNGSIAYLSPVVSGFQLAVQTSLMNNNTAADAATAATKSLTEVAVTFSQGPIKAMVGTQSSLIDTKSNAFAFSYDLGVATPSVAYVKSETSAGVEHTSTAIGVSIPMGALRLKAGHRILGTSTTGTADIKRTSLGATYSLSKRTSLLADTHKESGNTTAATNKQAYYLGVRHTF